MISVITPAYNAEPYIKQSLECILNQTYKDLELIVVLDCPTDNTETIVNEIAKQDSRVTIIKNTENLGAGASRFKGISQAKGEYILLNDADDYYSLNFIEDLYNAAVKYDADIVSGGITTISYDQSYIAEGQPEGVYVGIDKFKNQWSNGKILGMCNKLIRKTLYDKVPYVQRRYVEDTPTIVRQLWYANKVAVVNNTGYFHRLVTTSICHNVKPIDNAIYKSMCWCDLVEFFLENDKSILQNTNLLGTIGELLEQLNSLDVTEEELKPYEHDYCNTVSRIFKLIKITNIDLKI